jgi:hypothetical protein
MPTKPTKAVMQANMINAGCFMGLG